MKKPFVCPSDGCAKRFGRQHELRKHMKWHQVRELEWRATWGHHSCWAKGEMGDQSRCRRGTFIMHEMRRELGKEGKAAVEESESPFRTEGGLPPNMGKRRMWLDSMHYRD